MDSSSTADSPGIKSAATGEADGFVTRRPDPDDRRRALVELTAEGLATLQADRAARDGWLARAIAENLSEADHDILGMAVELLRQLAES
jgi:DNA-binding MarR family transcriptional regulator